MRCVVLKPCTLQHVLATAMCQYFCQWGEHLASKLVLFVHGTAYSLRICKQVRCP
jgi:hypothetical protein